MAKKKWASVNYLLPRLGLGLGVGLLALGLAAIWPPSSSPSVEIIPAAKEKEELVVDIEGAVVKPGVYQLPAGARINDLLIISGGLSREADRDWVSKNLNRAALVKDGAKVYIPQKREVSEEMIKGAVKGGKVNLNTASAAQLEQLPGIGPSLAKKIIDYREKEGGFSSLEELMAVPGIGVKLFDQLRERISL